MFKKYKQTLGIKLDDVTRILKESKIDFPHQDFVKLVAHSKMTIIDEEKDGTVITGYFLLYRKEI